MSARDRCKLVVKYKAHSSPSKGPKRPNFNQDGLIDDLTELYKPYQEDFEIKVFLEHVMRLNLLYSEGKLISKTGRGISDGMIQKCETTGLWLFLESHKINSHHLRTVCKGELK